jgi:hypothetical protein
LAYFKEKLFLMRKLCQPALVNLSTEYTHDHNRGTRNQVN